jgi:hypothetical protein
MSHSNDDFSTSSAMNVISVFVRLGWFMLGPGVMFLSFFAITQHGNSISWADGIFGLAAAACLVLRCVDVAFLKGQTGSGEPATMNDLWRYSIKLVIIVWALWGAAHGIAYLFA